MRDLTEITPAARINRLAHGQIAPRAAALWVIALASSFGALACGSAKPAAAPRLAVAVRGNQLVDGGGRRVRLRGVARSGPEFECVQRPGAIFDGPVDDSAIAAMRAWHVNAVLLPLNEDCWLGINGLGGARRSEQYQGAIAAYVERLHRAGIYVILDLHQTAPGRRLARFLQPMPDADHALRFWRTVAERFKRDPAVIFDLYNEPHQIGWRCLRDGCPMKRIEVRERGRLVTEAHLRWRAAGMASMLQAVRSTGARQMVLVGAPRWDNNFTQWLRYVPHDPQGQVAASFHVYADNECSATPCWDATVASVAAKFPVITGEIGEYDCRHRFIDSYMAWADRHDVSYLAWTWNAGDSAECASGPALVRSYDGTPTRYGAGLRDHLGALSAASGP